MNIYIANLTPDTSSLDLEKAFEKFGKLVYVNILKDEKTGISKGYGFVGMRDDAAAVKAIEALNNTQLNGKKIEVCNAHMRVVQRRFGADRRKPGNAPVEIERRARKDRRNEQDRRDRK